jgi:hypothetical protein
MSGAILFSFNNIDQMVQEMLLKQKLTMDHEQSPVTTAHHDHLVLIWTNNKSLTDHLRAVYFDILS